MFSRPKSAAPVNAYVTDPWVKKKHSKEASSFGLYRGVQLVGILAVTVGLVLHYAAPKSQPVATPVQPVITAPSATPEPPERTQDQLLAELRWLEDIENPNLTQLRLMRDYYIELSTLNPKITFYSTKTKELDGLVAKRQQHGEVQASGTEVSRTSFKGVWPLTVEGGTLNCENEFTAKLVTFTSGGKTYAVNGSANGNAKRRGWSEVDSIWKDNPEISGLKINIGPLIDLGLSLCR